MTAPRISLPGPIVDLIRDGVQHPGRNTNKTYGAAVRTAMSARQRGWAFAEHLLPHDAQVRELGTGKSRVETLRGLGINPRVLPALPVDDGINAARLMLPRCWFDAARCRGGLESLRQYRREWDERRKTFSSRPLHDWTSHAADAFRYLAVGLRPPPRKRAPGEAGGAAGGLAGGWMG